jgi:hypothetical protein
MLIGKAISMIVQKDPSYFLTGLGNDNEAVTLVENETAQNRFVVAHHFSYGSCHNLIKKKYKIIFLVRDPRDQLISVMQWLREGQWPWLQATGIIDLNEQIEELITGRKYGWRTFEDCFLSFESAINDLYPSVVYYAYFENLVGPQGGGTEEAQITEILNIAEFLNAKLSYNEARDIALNLFGGTGTFRTGQVGNWKHYFTEQHKMLYKTLYNKHLIRLGYEQNLKW